MNLLRKFPSQSFLQTNTKRKETKEKQDMCGQYVEGKEYKIREEHFLAILEANFILSSKQFQYNNMVKIMLAVLLLILKYFGVIMRMIRNDT